MNERKKLLAFILTFFLIFILLLGPNILFFIEKNEILKSIASWLIPTGLFLLPIFLFRRFIKGYFIIWSLFLLIAPVSLFSIFYFGDRLDFEVVSLMVFSTFNEASELIESFVWIIVIVYLVYFLVVFFCIKKAPKSLNKNSGLLLSSLGFFSLIIGMWIQPVSFPKYKIKESVLLYFPFEVVHNLFIANIYKNEMSRYKAESHKYSYSQVSTTDNTSDSIVEKVYILIIGETSRYQQWQINGYHRATSPKLMQQDNLISYSDVAAAGAITMYSVPQILTGTTFESYQDYLKTGGIPQLFKQAGFKVYWLSNQELISANTFIQSSFADTLILQSNSTHSSKNLNQDMALVEEMKHLLTEKSPKKLFILHTSGSHYKYQSRYPKSFEKFTPVENSKLVRPTDISNKEGLINSYDNSIYYTDNVINSCINAVKNINGFSSVIYTSDHGENLLDDERKFIFHSTGVISKYVGHIPLFVFCNDNYIDHNPNKWNWLMKNKNRKASNNQIMSTLADIANVTYEEQNKSNSLASEFFKESQQKIMISSKKYKTLSDLYKDK
ncbi:MAG TPA: phosphoethanolamine transferase [Edaphocola sp.]|nr:phosphoethanolamine transferase [Edaphocola sp.]